MAEAGWWRDAVIYEVYVRSFADSDGDGVGDLPGIREHLDHVAWLGVDAVWCTPFFASPMADHGYDVSDFRDVDPLFGSLADADALIADAHRHGLRSIIDIVPNHTSREHPWFERALAGDPDHRARYVFRDPAAGGGPPNQWVSVFGGSAWTLDDASGQYYLHLFAPEQPDLDWRHPAVRDEFRSILRFWLERGADGFRIDVAHGLIKDRELRDTSAPADAPVPGTDYQGLEQSYAFDQPEVHDIHRDWRRLTDAYPGDRALLGEVYLLDPERVAAYVRPDELHLAFDFSLLAQAWSAPDMRRTIDATMAALAKVGGTPCWVVSSHDVARAATRFGGGEQGRRRARANLLLLLALPGAVSIFQGEELGLEDAVVPDDERQDPIFHRTGGRMQGRDGCRVPIPWDPELPWDGFTTGRPWLPMPRDRDALTVRRQREDRTSMLHLVRDAIAIRRGRRTPGGATVPPVAWRDTPPGVLGFDWGPDGRWRCFVNLSPVVTAVRVAGTPLLVSGPDVVADPDGSLTLPPDGAAWCTVGDRS